VFILKIKTLEYFTLEPLGISQQHLSNSEIKQKKYSSISIIIKHKQEIQKNKYSKKIIKTFMGK